MDSGIGFSLLSWNVLAFAGHPSGPFVTQPGIVAEGLDFITKLNPDIVALQEAPDLEVFRQDVMCVQTQSVWPHSRFFSARWPGNHEFPQGFPGILLSRFMPLVSEDRVEVNRVHLAPAVFQRHWGRTLLALPGGLPVWLVQTHLCADFNGRNHTPIRVQEVRLLLEDLNTLDPTVPVIVCGDLNCLPGSEPYQLLLDTGFSDSCLEPTKFPTVPVPGPLAKIDAILFRGHGLTCNGFSRPELKQDRIGRWLSDHYPILAYFTLH